MLTLTSSRCLGGKVDALVVLSWQEWRQFREGNHTLLSSYWIIEEWTFPHPKLNLPQESQAREGKDQSSGSSPWKNLSPLKGVHKVLTTSWTRPAFPVVGINDEWDHTVTRTAQLCLPSPAFQLILNFMPGLGRWDRRGRPVTSLFVPLPKVAILNKSFFLLPTVVP